MFNKDKSVPSRFSEVVQKVSEFKPGNGVQREIKVTETFPGYSKTSILMGLISIEKGPKREFTSKER